MENKITICPFCAKQNNCMVENIEICWCKDIKVPKELLVLVPKNNKKKGCICKNCVLEFKKDQNTFIEKLNI